MKIVITLVPEDNEFWDYDRVFEIESTTIEARELLNRATTLLLRPPKVDEL